ncbi:hypothetical protein [Actinokineospora sp.]|uniref:hypothetical protein n=1 Tax=Actinokineospora sp. TaxID=1872133 RepID=UPI0040383EBF
MDNIMVSAPNIPAPPWSESDLAAVLEDMSTAYAPRLFTVFEIAADREDARIHAWGMDFGPDESCWFHTADGGASGSISSPERLLRALRNLGDFRLVRHDAARADE